MTRTQTSTSDQEQLAAHRIQTENRPSRLGTPLAAFRDIALCDRLHHEVAIVTDGQRAYAWGLGTSATDAGPVHRSGVILTADCSQPARDGKPCDGQVTWAIDSPCWGTDGDALTLLAAYGQAVEQ